MLGVHAKDKPLANDVSLKTIAMRTPGFSGADLENLLNEAALVAAREDAKMINMSHVDEAIDRVIAGPAKKSRVISKKEKNIVAYHESGHTVIGVVLNDADMVHKVTICPRGQAGGYAVMLPREDRYFQTKPELLDKKSLDCLADVLLRKLCSMKQVQDLITTSNVQQVLPDRMVTEIWYALKN